MRTAWLVAFVLASKAAHAIPRRWEKLPDVGIVYEHPAKEERLRTSWEWLAKHTRVWSLGIYATYLKGGDAEVIDRLGHCLDDLGFDRQEAYLQDFADFGSDGAAFKELLLHAIWDRWDVLVLIDPSVILSPRWLNPLVAALEYDTRVGAVEPLNNGLISRRDRAHGSSKLSPSRLRQEDMESMLKEVDSTARIVSLSGDSMVVAVGQLQGRVLAIAGDVIEKEYVHLMEDQDHWETVLGGVQMLLGRLKDTGHRFLVAPKSYVYVPTFSPTYDMVSNPRNGSQIANGHVPTRLNANTHFISLWNCRPFFTVKKTIASRMIHTLPVGKDFSVLFVLNKMSRANKFSLRGGWISIVQECLGLAAHGAHVRMAVPAWTAPHFESAFPEAASMDLFLPFEATTSAKIATELIMRKEIFDFVVATLFTTVPTVEKICSIYSRSIKSYYVQDVEAKFSPLLQAEAEASYKSMANGFVFVKSNYLAKKIRSMYGIRPFIIPPTVDTALFHPGDFKEKAPAALVICAMVRVATPRRNPYKTYHILAETVRKYGTSIVQARAFGSSDEEISLMLENADSRRPIPEGLQFLGYLNRTSVAQLFQECDLFLDFSAWQAFGRSGIECMAAGCVPILPLAGGCLEYAIDRVNSFLIDSSDVQRALNVIDEIIDSKIDLNTMKLNAIQTARSFSINKSGSITATLFRDVLEKSRRFLSLSKPNKTLVC